MEALSTLKEVQGVLGSFLVDAHGKVVANDAPTYISEAIEQIGARLLHTAEALGMFNGNHQLCSLNYQNYRLILRSSDAGLMSVLAERHTNLAALRMALNLVNRQLSRESSLSHQERLTTAPQLSLPTSQSSPSLLTALPQPVSEFSTSRPQNSTQFTPSPSAMQSSSLAPTSRSSLAPSSIAPSSPGSNSGSPAAGLPTQQDVSGKRKKRPVYFRGKRVG